MVQGLESLLENRGWQRVCKVLIELREKLKGQIANGLVDENNYLEQRDKQVKIKDINFFLSLPQDLITKENQKIQTRKG